MGRTVILMVILATIIFATITLVMQKRGLEAPDILAGGVDSLQAKYLSNYAISYTIKAIKDSLGTNGIRPSNVPLNSNLVLNTTTHGLNSSSLQLGGYIDSLTVRAVGNKDTLRIYSKARYGRAVNRSMAIIALVDSIPASEKGYWKVDVDGQNSIATGKAATLHNINVQTTVGKKGGSLQLQDNGDSYASLATGAEEDVANDFTVSSWVRVNWPSEWLWNSGTLLAEYSNDVALWSIRYVADDKGFINWPFFWQQIPKESRQYYVLYTFWVKTGSGLTYDRVELKVDNQPYTYFYDPDGNVNPNAWHHIAGRYKRVDSSHAEITIMVDGVIQKKIINAVRVTPPTSPVPTVCFGGAPSITNTMEDFFGNILGALLGFVIDQLRACDVNMDEIKVFNTALDDSFATKYLYNGITSKTFKVIDWQERM